MRVWKVDDICLQYKARYMNRFQLNEELAKALNEYEQNGVNIKEVIQVEPDYYQVIYTVDEIEEDDSEDALEE